MDFVSSVSLVGVSLWVLVFSVIIILFSLAFIFWRNRDSVEEKHADSVLRSLGLLKEGKVLSKKVSEDKPVLEIKKDEFSLKHLLIKKFKPKIEQQLSTKVEVLDFNAKENTFLALVEISGVKILLTLDSAGKIIDYKKVKA